MPNWIVVHKPSQLIKSVITSPKPPTQDHNHSFHLASPIVLNKYYKQKTKANKNGVLVSAGDLAAASPSFYESLKTQNKH